MCAAPAAVCSDNLRLRSATSAVSRWISSVACFAPPSCAAATRSTNQDANDAVTTPSSATPPSINPNAIRRPSDVVGYRSP